MKSKPKLHVTKNYDLFDLLPFNRSVESIKHLKASMKTHGFLEAYPLHCVQGANGKLKIKAGNHRFVVAKELGLPIPYVVCDDNASIYELEKATNRWSLQDYLTSFCHCELAAYKEVAEYVDRTRIGLSASISMFSGRAAGSGNDAKAFKSGTFQIAERKHPELVARAVEHCAKEGLVFARNRFFVSAISKVLFVPEFDLEQFVKKISVHSAICKKQPHVDGYLELIETVYNRGSHSKIPLVFRSKEVMRERRDEYFSRKAKRKR